jgi:hypothetical protein
MISLFNRFGLTSYSLGVTCAVGCFIDLYSELFPVGRVEYQIPMKQKSELTALLLLAGLQ